MVPKWLDAIARPAFLELSSDAPHGATDATDAPGGVATPVEPVVVASGARPGLLPKAVWRSKAEMGWFFSGAENGMIIPWITMIYGGLMVINGINDHH